MFTDSAPPPVVPAVPIGTTVHLLRRWDRHDDQISLYHSYSAALAALAAFVRAAWADTVHRAGVPDTPQELSNAQTVVTYYDSVSGEPDAPTAGEAEDAGFVIVAEAVAGPEPSEVELRLATLRVLDADPAESDIPAVTYCLDATGLTIAVSTGPDGYPAVLITPDAHLSGVPVTVRLEDPFHSDGIEQTHRVS